MEPVVIVVAVGALLGNAAAAAWMFESGTPAAASLRRSLRSPRAWLVAVLAAFAGLALGVPWVYATTTDDAPEPLSFDDAGPLLPASTTSTSARSIPLVTRPAPAVSLVIPNPSITAPQPTAPILDGRRGVAGDGGVPPAGEAPSTTAASAVSGLWVVGRGSIAGYRADEVLVLQKKSTAGRTDRVRGSMVIEGLTVTEVTVSVNMGAVSSDNAQRDDQFRGPIMDVVRHPTSDFRLTEPIVLDGVPPEGEIVEREATGELTIRGVTRVVTFPLEARLRDGRIEVLASIPVRWSDYRIPDPSTPLTQVEDHGTIELLLLFDRG